MHTEEGSRGEASRRAAEVQVRALLQGEPQTLGVLAIVIFILILVGIVVIVIIIVVEVIVEGNAQVLLLLRILDKVGGDDLGHLFGEVMEEGHARLVHHREEGRVKVRRLQNLFHDRKLADVRLR